jgi:hypothetical protein
VAATVGPDGTTLGVTSCVLHAAATPAVTAIAVLLAVVDKNCLRFITVLLSTHFKNGKPSMFLVEINGKLQQLVLAPAFLKCVVAEIHFAALRNARLRCQECADYKGGKYCASIDISYAKASSL